MVGLSRKITTQGNKKRPNLIYKNKAIDIGRNIATASAANKTQRGKTPLRTPFDTSQCDGDTFSAISRPTKNIAIKDGKVNGDPLSANEPNHRRIFS